MQVQASIAVVPKVEVYNLQTENQVSRDSGLATEGTARRDVVLIIMPLVKPSKGLNIEPCEVLGRVRNDSAPGVGLVDGDASELQRRVRTGNDLRGVIYIRLKMTV